MSIKNINKQYIYLRENKKCYFCGKPLKYHQITLDHYIPRSKKGTEDIFNLVTCCRKCNKLKDNFLPEDHEDIVLMQFLRAVEDGRILGENLKISHKTLKNELLNVNRLEALNDYFIFQSPTKRFYIKNNKVIKIVVVTQSILNS